MAWHHLTLLPAILCMVAAIMLWDDGAAGVAPIPGVAYAQVDVPAAYPPRHEEFDAFWRDDDNPFVPYSERQESARPASGGQGWRDAAPPPLPQPEPPPDRIFARALPGQAVMPVPVGYCSGDRQTWVRVRDPTTMQVIEVEPGTSLNGFVFSGLEAGNIAVFKDETERVYRLVIGTR